MDRRRFLSTMGSVGGGFGAAFMLSWHAQAAQWLNMGAEPIDTTGLSTRSQDVFDLSVSSADPSPTGVILWTHIAASAVASGEDLFVQVAQDGWQTACQCIRWFVLLPVHLQTRGQPHRSLPHLAGAHLRHQTPEAGFVDLSGLHQRLLRCAGPCGPRQQPGLCLALG